MVGTNLQLTGMPRQNLHGVFAGRWDAAAGGVCSPERRITVRAGTVRVCPAARGPDACPGKMLLPDARRRPAWGFAGDEQALARPLARKKAARDLGDVRAARQLYAMLLFSPEYCAQLARFHCLEGLFGCSLENVARKRVPALGGH